MIFSRNILYAQKPWNAFRTLFWKCENGAFQRFLNLWKSDISRKTHVSFNEKIEKFQIKTQCRHVTKSSLTWFLRHSMDFSYFIGSEALMFDAMSVILLVLISDLFQGEKRKNYNVQFQINYKSYESCKRISFFVKRGRYYQNFRF